MWCTECEMAKLVFSRSRGEYSCPHCLWSPSDEMDDNEVKKRYEQVAVDKEAYNVQ